MFGDGHEFDVSETHFLDVGDEAVGEFAIGEPFAAVVALAPPGAEMYFVDADGFVEAAVLATVGDPVAVAPLVLIDVPND